MRVHSGNFRHCTEINHFMIYFNFFCPFFFWHQTNRSWSLAKIPNTMASGHTDNRCYLYIMFLGGCLYFFSKIFCKLVFLIIKFTRTKSLIMQILKAFIYIAQVILDNPNRYLFLSHHFGAHKQQCQNQ